MLTISCSVFPWIDSGFSGVLSSAAAFARGIPVTLIAPASA